MLKTGAVLLLLAGGAEAQKAAPKPSRQEEARRKLLEQMGLEKKPPVPPRPPEPPGAEPLPTPVPTPAPRPAATDAAAPPEPVVPFAGRVHDLLLGACRTCHTAGASAGATRFVLDGRVGHDHDGARKLVDTAKPRDSLLLSKAIGIQHGGGPTLPPGSGAYRQVLRWIETGAQMSSPGQAGTPVAAASSTDAPGKPRTPASVGAAPVISPSPVAPRPALAQPAPTAMETPKPTVPSATPTVSAEPPPRGSEPHPTALALHAQMQKACLPCHRVGGPAATSRYILTGALDGDLVASRAFVDRARPADSVLVTKAAGQPHGGGAIWPPGSEGHEILLAWTEAAIPDRAVLPPAAASPAEGAAPTMPAAKAPLPLAPTRPAAPPFHPGGVPLLGNELTLNGRFDLNLERRGFEGNPWGAGSRTALQSYHHFLFLSRQSADDPFTFTAEVINLEFYELALRLGPRRRGWRLHLRAGKLLIPFGAEPLFHQSYGGHMGFDQRVLPPIWAAEGLVASSNLDVGPLTLGGDLYGVRGYGLRRADAVLNLQSDLSPVEDARLAIGMRLGAALSALSGFYSAYFNPLGHGRRLFMQALDVSLWRWRRLPVLDRLVLAAGLLRADVSGGGSPVDYYHFASYWLVRLYTLDWLHLQYRQGLRTFDNKRNLIYDRRRAGPEDGSTHNVAVGVRYRGLSLGVSYYLNLEKAGEVDDDLLRLSVAYEF